MQPDDLVLQETLLRTSLYIESAFKAQGREVPADPTLAMGICLHWAVKGEVIGYDDWCKLMFGETPETGRDDFDDELDFKITNPDGVVRHQRMEDGWRAVLV